MDKIRVIIDTDIGDDIDDAFALCLAMQSPELEIMGVTTVFKDTVKRAMMAKRLLKLGGFGHVPVYAGAPIPLSNWEMFGKKVDFSETPHSFRDKYIEDIDLSKSGADFIIDTLENSSGKITLITLGALTNIADVLRRRPGLKDKIDRIHVMGGAYYTNWTEYNFACDPEAADMVLRSGICIKAVGTDITFKCRVDEPLINKLLGNPHPCIQTLMEMCSSWNGSVYLHDPLAVGTVFDDSFVTFERKTYCVEHDAKYSRGMCVHLSDHNWKADPLKSNLYVGASVRSDIFVEACINRLMQFSEGNV